LQKAAEGAGRWCYVTIDLKVNQPDDSTPFPIPINITLRFGEMQMLKHLLVKDPPQLIPLVNVLVELAPCSALDTLAITGAIDFTIPNANESSLYGYIFPKLETILLHPLYAEDYPNCWKLLKLSSHVECLDLNLLGEFGADPLVPAIELPRLQELFLRMDPENAIAILERFSLPSLESLTLETTLSDATLIDLANTIYMKAFPITRCSLQEIGEEPFSAVLFAVLLQSMGELRSLELCPSGDAEPQVYSALMDALTTTLNPTPDSNPESNLPHLTSLTIVIDPQDAVGEEYHRPVKELILACWGKYRAGFEFTLWLTPNCDNGKEIAARLCKDLEILKCVSESFLVVINEREIHVCE